MPKNKLKSKMTLDNLAKMVTDGFGRTESALKRTATKIELDDLAMMVARGFESTATKEELGEVKNDLNKLRGEMNLRFDDVEKKIEKVDARVDEVYEIITRFEEGDILDLQSRVKLLERAVRAIAKRIQ